MLKNHDEFLNQLKTFKDMLLQQNQTNLKYLQCRLDFNEYYQYQEMKIKAEMENRRRHGGGGGALDDLDDFDDDGEDDEDGDEDDEEEDDYDDEEDHNDYITPGDGQMQQNYAQGGYNH